MKVGVLTYHKELSQGASFQAYATYRALHELGCEVEIIDLVHKNKSPRPWWQRLIIDLYLFLSYYRQSKFRRDFYPSFSRKYNNIEELRQDPPSIDAACVGSDQTWNLNIATKENMLAYFLDFGPIDLYRFSYAPSFGYAKWQIEDGKETKRVVDILNSYIGLSVREVTGQRILKDMFDLDATLVCDPTILHANYDEFTKGLKQKNEVVCYSLATSSAPKIKAMHDISNHFCAPIRWVGKPFFVKGVKNTYFPDVYRWFRKLAGSKFILTDSFHGTVVALLCQKPFAVLYEDNGLSSRIVDLLTRLGLEDRIFYNYDDFSKSAVWKKPIDYKKVNVLLEHYRRTSWDYLRNVISKINQLRNE